MLCHALLLPLAALAAAPPDPRIEYARERLEIALGPAARQVDLAADGQGAPESYRIDIRGKRIRIRGADAAGAMYGALEVASRARGGKRLPGRLALAESPALSLRGTCVFLMKLGTYDYPVTPREFPFFYDKKLWIEYLDFLAAHRFNYIAFWNGHPFDYFVKLDKYPEAQAGMEPGLVERNHDMLMWLGREAERRNIWLMFQFYNIHVSVYFRQAHGLPALNRVPTPLLADYTAHSIERFVSEFPSVGLYICPGEALRLEHTDSWINNVIFPAVRRTGKNPPIMVRAWGIDLPHMRKVAGNYEPLYTERKFNYEMIASTDIDPENAEWARITGRHVVNIHCVGNLEPFRWSAPTYIQKIIQSSLGAGATGLHLYPRKVWRWPYGCDRQDQPELQWHRDWMWFEAWGRYAWSAARDPAAERRFWLSRLEGRYGNPAAARHALDYFEAAADVLPAIQRLVWLHYDNHWVVPAGILLDQLERAKGIPFLDLPGITRIPEYLGLLAKGLKPSGRTPADLLAEKVNEAERALAEARQAAAKATARRPEAARLASDAEAVLLVARFYLAKMEAAAAKAAGDRPRFLERLEASVQHYRDLTRLTRTTYESISDVPMWYPLRFKPDICPYHWSDVLPAMEEELARLK